MKSILLCAALCCSLGPVARAGTQDLLQIPVPQTAVSGLPSLELQRTQSPSEAQAPAKKNPLPPDAREMLLLSLSARDYPVTPGDVYRLSYRSADASISFDAVVESDLTVNLGFFGKMAAPDLTFLELKRQVEQRVLGIYPQSSPSITIVSNGIFQVRVEGEVTEAGEATAWGLSRLSQVVASRLTPYSSIRDVTVVSPSDAKHCYDLFRALRFGEEEQDPYVGPGDTVILSKRDRSIELVGEVKRPGTYQPLPHEGLEELIEYYGDGFTVQADPSRIRVERLVTDGRTIAESFIVDLSTSMDAKIELCDMDTLVVPPKMDRLPVVFVEGAIIPQSGTDSNPIAPRAATDARAGEYSKFPVQIKEGATLYQILLDRRDQIYPTADLAHAYLVRRNPDEVVPVDLERLLFAYRPQDDVVLRAYDHLVIPFRWFSVAVTGAVRQPGVYPYVPDKTFQYYVDMAGGIDPERGRPGSVQVFDRAGQKLPSDSLLDPEGKVEVPYSFSFYFFKYFPIVVSASLAVVTGLYYLDQINR
jgi:polysaccharide export outer membrane protein